MLNWLLGGDDSQQPRVPEEKKELLELQDLGVTQLEPAIEDYYVDCQTEGISMANAPWWVSKNRLFICALYKKITQLETRIEELER